MTQNDPPPNRRWKWLAAASLFFVLMGLVWVAYWLFIGRFYVYTDDAYVYGNQVALIAQVSSGVKAIYADDTDLVRESQLLVELDDSDYQILFEANKEQLGMVVRTVVALFQDVEAKRATVLLRRAELRQAELDCQHRAPLVTTGAVSVEEFEIYQTNVVVAAASLAEAEKQLERAESLVADTTVETHPMVEEQLWKVRESYLNLIRCHVWAPATGYIAKRAVQVGDQVNEGTTLLYVVPLDEIWIQANYKETQLKHIRIDQPVRYTADMYGRNLVFHGKVVGFQPGTGNAFALLPPENASGNWIKILQRVPVRITITAEEIQQNPLFLGLSMHVYTHIKDRTGKRLAQQATEEPIYTTRIYSQQMEETMALDPLLDDLIRMNKAGYIPTRAELSVEPCSPVPVDSIRLCE